jgi:hypothetical protein
VVLPLTEAASTSAFVEQIASQASSIRRNNDDSLVTSVSFSNLKSRFTFVQPASRDVTDCLDLCQLADILLFISKEGMVAGELVDQVHFTLRA